MCLINDYTLQPTPMSLSTHAAPLSLPRIELGREHVCCFPQEHPEFSWNLPQQTKVPRVGARSSKRVGDPAWVIRRTVPPVAYRVENHWQSELRWRVRVIAGALAAPVLTAAAKPPIAIRQRPSGTWSVKYIYAD